MDPYQNHFPNILEYMNDDSNEDLESIIATSEEKSWDAENPPAIVVLFQAIKRLIVVGMQVIKDYHDYFYENPVYHAHLFFKRFHMSSPLFCPIVVQAIATSEYFRQRPDSVKVLGWSSIKKIIVVVWMLAYGKPTNSMDEYV